MSSKNPSNPMGTKKTPNPMGVVYDNMDGTRIDARDGNIHIGLGDGYRSMADQYVGTPAGGTGNPFDRGPKAPGSDTPTGGGGGSGGGGGGGGGGGYTKLPGATSQEAYIRELYADARRRDEEALRSAYNEKVAAIDTEQARLDPFYDSAANQAAVQAEIQKQNLNRQLAASGVNTGAGSQMQLSQNIAGQANQAAIRQEQARRNAELEAERSDLASRYKDAIAEAIRENNLKLAEALYQEAVRVDNSMVETAAREAQLNR